MMERVRLQTLCARDGAAAAREWARRAAALYRRSISDPAHYATHAEKKPLFERSIHELETFAETGAIT
jgi:hypothetical protein